MQKVMKKLLTLLLVFTVTFALAQDAYHQNISTFFEVAYDLPQADFVLFDNEVDIMNNVFSYNLQATTEEISGQDFSLYSEVTVGAGGTNPWDSGWGITNTLPVANGEKLMLVVWLKAEGIPPASATANVYIERVSDFTKEFYAAVNINSQWRQYFIPVEVMHGDYAPGEVAFGLHLGAQAQTVRIGGFTVLRYGEEIDLADMPSQYYNELYGGYEDDAEWRATAADNIDLYRKADLTINAQTTDGTPVPNAAFDIEMTRHEYAFGSAVLASRLADNNDFTPLYQEKIINLDGAGHGFNWVVFENDLKWDGWEQMWLASHEEVINAADWVAAQGIKMRGHTLVWPGFQYMPDDIQANQNNPDYVWNRIDAHLEEMLTLPNFESNVSEWDALNEIAVNTDLEPVFADWNDNETGREIYADILTRAEEISPATKWYINDYVTMSLGNTDGPLYDDLKNKIQEVIDSGAPLDGIGFQAHIGGSPNSIYDVLGTLDDFYDSFDKTHKITEFDLPPGINQQLAADYLRDFLTAVFSHESTDGFIFWNFWDGATFMNPGANLFNEDWSMTAPGDAFVNLVFEEWRTDETRTADPSGNIETRVFKGDYEITYICNGETITETRSITDNTEITIECDNLATDIENIPVNQSPNFSVFPNPAHDFITVEKRNRAPAELRLTDTAGKLILTQTLQNSVETLPLNDLRGMYFLEILQGEERYFMKVVFE